ncbi:two-component sensor histidine kinase [Amycolatopsis sp. H6(2020)]|nr:two-component sensor histidine kinase [Amycolatopsis sp. H6(2020)]
MAAAVSLVVVSVLGPPENAAYSPAGIAVGCGALALLPFRRRAPLTVGWLVAATAVGMTVVELVAPGTLAHTELTPLVPLAVTPFAAYAALAFTADRRVAWAPVAILAIIAARPWEPSGQGITQALLVTAGPALLGMYVAARQRLVKHMLAEQRTRLAADMHDTITHRISLIILRAGVLGMSTSDEAVRATAEELRSAGCQALEELQELLHVLRDGFDETGEPVAPVQSWAPVPELLPLIAESRSAGVHAELVEDGDAATVSPVVRRTAHRIVQESLTNVRKHAPGTDVRVHVRYGGDAVYLAVYNTTPTQGPDPALTATGSGAGLHNLRQRVELVGGTLRAGPATDGGFHVVATLPALVS